MMCVAFISCSDEDSDNKLTVGGVVYEKLSENTVRVIGGDGNITELVIPQTITVKENTYTVKEIGPSAFERDLKINSVYIPNSVVTVGANAFRDCYNIYMVVLGTGVKSIGDYAFYSEYMDGTFFFLASTPPVLGVGVFYKYRTSFFVPEANYEVYNDALFNKYTSVPIGKITDEIMDILKEYGY